MSDTGNEVMHTPGKTFQEIDRKPLRYEDKAGVMHACEGADVHRGVRLIWTLCQRDVPANAAFLSFEKATCEKCFAALTKAQGL
jgi:hypothetical protein